MGGFSRIKKTLAVAVLCLAAMAAAAVIPTAASAHAGTWKWSERAAELELVASYLEWSDAAMDDVVDAECVGQGRFIYNSSYTKLYKHFRCLVETSTGEEYYIKLHVLDRDNFTYRFLGYA